MTCTGVAAPSDLIISRAWSMPCKNTFSIKVISDIINKYKHGLTIDPYANSCRISDITNDLDPEYDTDYHLDALDFLKLFEDCSVGTVLWDPPFSPRQVSESYKKFDRSVNWETTTARYWAKQKEEISRIVEPDGIVITCAWNSGGIGKSYGFELQEILLVAHGAHNHDTIVTVERKLHTMPPGSKRAERSLKSRQKEACTDDL